MSGELVSLRSQDYSLKFYDSGCKAIAEAATIDEIKSIADKSVAVKAYARQVKNKKLFADAEVILKRAERRTGEIMAEMRREGTLASRGQKRSDRPSRPILQVIDDIGLSEKEAKRAVRLAVIPKSDFEERLDKVRDAVEAGRRSGLDKIMEPTLRRQPPSIDKVVSQTWRFWDRIRQGDELEKLKEIAANKRHAQQVEIDHLRNSLEKVIKELEKIARRLS